MACPECGASPVPIDVPSSVRAYAPEEAPAVAACHRCLTVAPIEHSDAGGDPAAVHEAFPDGEAGVAAVLLVGLLDSLALNRDAVEALIDRLERDGVDPLSLLGRLDRDPDLDPAVDIDRRRHQLVQLL